MDKLDVHVDLANIQVIHVSQTMITITKLHEFFNLANFYHRLILVLIHVVWKLSKFTMFGVEVKLSWFESRHEVI